jgi:methylglyoxal reductase
MDALKALKKAGKIRAIGASNVDANDLGAYIAAGELDAIQERFSMIDREIEATLLPLTMAKGVSTLSYSSLALGLLSGTVDADRVFSGDDQRRDNPRFSVANRKKVAGFADAIRPIADAHGATIAQIVIAWTLAQPGITFALCGARNPAQAKDNARAATIRLAREETSTIDTAIASWLSVMDG